MIDFIKRYQWWLFAVILLGCFIAYYERWRGYRENSQDPVILAAAERYGVNPALIKAIVWRESWFNPKAKGRSGEIGLMQVRKEAAEEWAAAERISLFTHSQLFDPGKNTRAGTWYFRKQLLRFRHTDNAVPYALAAYNAGAAQVQRWAKGAAATNSSAFIRQIAYSGTRSYVEAVVKRSVRYQKAFRQKNRAGSSLPCGQSYAAREFQRRGDAETGASTTRKPTSPLRIVGELQ